jgi:diguanylate cyclase (GGDEF)-like protein
VAVPSGPVGIADWTRRYARSIRGWSLWTVSSGLRVYVLVITAFTTIVAAVAGLRLHWRPSDMLVFAALIACGIIAIESTRMVREIQGAVGRDLQTVWYLAIAISLPPAYALLAPVPLTAYRLWRVRRGFVYRRVFSNATISLAYGCVSYLFRAVPANVAGPHPGIGLHALSWTAIVAAAGSVAWLINNGLILVGIRIADPQARIRDMFGNREAITSDLIELSLAVSLSLVVAINPILAMLGLPSVVLYRRYLMNAQLVAQVRIDAKTGLLNAGTWQREAEVELLRALRGRTPLALAMVDIDHFGDLDETAGYLVRDQLLRDVAGMLKEQLPDHDLIGRFTGEEFVILLPHTGQDEARRLSERLRDHIAGEPIAIESGDQAGFVFRLTVSIGVAVLNESRRALGELIGAADLALDQAKSTGWNKVCVINGNLRISEVPGSVQPGGVDPPDPGGFASMSVSPSIRSDGDSTFR